MKRILASAIGLVLVMAVAGSAHLRTDRNWAAVQVPIGVDGIRDVEMDGDLGDWDNVPSAFWVTHDDLVETVTGTQGDPDPGNLAERIIFGWSPVTNFLYVMEEKFDDFFYGTIDNNFDTLEVMLDFDHSADPIFQKADLGIGQIAELRSQQRHDLADREPTRCAGLRLRRRRRVGGAGHSPVTRSGTGHSPVTVRSLAAAPVTAPSATAGKAA